MDQLRIISLTADGMDCPFVTDTVPRFTFAVNGPWDSAELALDGRNYAIGEQVGVTPEGFRMKPHTKYTVVLTVRGETGEDRREFTFFSGKMDENWYGRWITDGEYTFTEEKVSPVPMTFRKKLNVPKSVEKAEVYATAIGIYELSVNGRKAGDAFFAPGFTSYAHDLQYQVYDITSMLAEETRVVAEVAGGWAVGSFVFTRANRITSPRQALRLEIRYTLKDGSVITEGTDESWEVCEDGPVRMADLYDGETYDARIDPLAVRMHAASLEQVNIHPRVSADIGVPVRMHERFQAEYLRTVNGHDIYDFGQNFAGIVHLKINGKAGQKIVIRHAEILTPEGELNTAFLRSAKATATYICRDGEQEWHPRFTYMGFRYISVEGAEKGGIELTAYALYSDLRKAGDFECSNEKLNRLHRNIRWGAKSNFVEIPTDCPQRDERMGWTGDIAVFAPTACRNFDMTRFLTKWLRDLRSEQHRGGGVPNCIPIQGYGFPTTMPVMAIDFWGDACVMVPWALYMATGDRKILSDMAETMEKYVRACRFWAGVWGVGEYRYIWHTPATLHFGDWIAPDEEKMIEWQKRSKWTATASLYHTSSLLGGIFRVLGENEKAEKYESLAGKVAKAYQDKLMDADGKLKKEFQTGYVLPLHFGMLDAEHEKKAAAHLNDLVTRNGYRVGTGFPGTPYLLFALADHGYEETAFKMLLCEECPSWLYEVRVGATTVWERWDGLDEDGNCPIGNDGTGGMISYNHYASGAVGNFLYCRVLGVEALSGGYREFRMKPLIGGGITRAKGSVETPYGLIRAEWEKKGESFTMRLDVPYGTTCEAVMPSGEKQTLEGGRYEMSEKMPG